MMQAPDIQQLAISVAVSIADAPFTELEAQAAFLAASALCGSLTKQQAADIAFTGARSNGLVHRFGLDAVQEAIAWGFERALDPVEAPPIVPAKAVALPAKPEYQTPQSTIDAFWYTVRNEDAATLQRWIAEHPKDAPLLRKLWKARLHDAAR